MDVLSDAIAAMRTGRPHSSRTHKQAPWGMRFQPFTGAGFHVVLQGACWLIPPAGDPVVLGVGDVAFLPHGTGYGLADALSTPLRELPPTSLAEFKAGSIAVEPAPPNSAGASTVLLCGAYLLDQARAHPLLRELPPAIHLPARVGRAPSLRAAVDLLGTELEEPSPGTDAVVAALLDMLLLYILRAWYEEQSHHHPITGWAAALNDPAIIAALHGIHNDPARQWTVQSLGAEGALSRAPFARRFTTLVGLPPLTYLTWWRMSMAARLLDDSDASLRTVAEQTGYTSEFAFARAFKREYGLAPGAYRRQRRAESPGD